MEKININNSQSVIASKSKVIINGIVENLTCTDCDLKISGMVNNISRIKEVEKEKVIFVPKACIKTNEYRKLYDENKQLKKIIEGMKERNAIMENANHDQADRIKELERIIEEHREAEYRSVWDTKPSKVDCERVVRILDLDVFDF